MHKKFLQKVKMRLPRFLFLDYREGMTDANDLDLDDRDTLQRHLTTHQPALACPIGQAVNGTAPRGRGDKACSSCRVSKQRCNGALPCQRCAEKRRACIYHPRRPRQVRIGPISVPQWMSLDGICAHAR